MDDNVMHVLISVVAVVDEQEDVDDISVDGGHRTGGGINNF